MPDTDAVSDLVRRPAGAVARVVGAVVVTGNVGAFGRVAGLGVENWRVG